ncbi:MAG: (d)CMP kinase [Marinobacterium sp.]|nr:(d)CMP kinase [Marinobacterium sp.]
MNETGNICVIGTSGTGKSTISKQLADKLQLRHIEMDSLYWLPDWQEPAFPVFLAKLDAATQQDGWVMDGNYSRANTLKWARAQTVVWVDYSLPRILWQATQRAIRRIISRQELWPGSGNRESFRLTFMSKHSILLWSLKTFRSNRKRHQQWMHSEQCAHLQFVHLRSPRQVQAWLDTL